MYIIPMLTSSTVVFLMVPLVRRLAWQLGFYDLPGTRKIHRRPVPLLGGAALYAGVMIPLLVFVGFAPISKTILTGGTLLLATGLLDDWHKTRGRNFPVWPRLIVYLAASAVPLWHGIEIIGITAPGGGMILFSRWLVWASTILWVFAITNMINFIDGVDGLASGIITIASSALLLSALLHKQPDSAMLAAILLGSCLAFLAYNFHPALIFMGDAGAVFLGYTIAVIAVDGAFKSATVLSVAVPFLALGVPILDTAVVFVRRLLRGRGLHRADNLHAHHMLMRWGLSQVQTVSFLYLIGIAFSLASVILLLLNR